MSEPTTEFSRDALGSALRDVLLHVDPTGWGLPPTVYALVPTATLAETDPHLVGEDDDSVLSPVQQEVPDLDDFLARAGWPPMVAGAAIVLEIRVAAPDSPDGASSGPDKLVIRDGVADDDTRQARIAVGALRGGATVTLLRLRDEQADSDPSAQGAEPELLTHPDLAADLRAALLATFDPED